MTAQSYVSPTSRPIRKYYEMLEDLRKQGVSNEMSVRSAFQSLLADTAHSKGWTLVPELADTAVGGSLVRPDGTLRDSNGLPRGYWEAKDTRDDLETEIKRKIARGYSLSNIIFEDTETGILYQNKQRVDGPFNLGDARELANLLRLFYAHTEPEHEGFEKAVDEFKERVPELARGLAEKIKEAHHDNARFQQAFEAFFKLCQTALNPNIRVEAVDEMLVQHLLTERLIRTIFDNPDFTRHNAIAAEVERVIDALVSHSFNRSEYLKSLDPFYRAIESAARTLPDFSDKQHFLNTVYERFFQGYSVKLADTHGIVYTPQPIVNFMCASVAEVLEKEFGKNLSSPDVYIIDPCTGTGNFIVNLLRRIPKRELPRMYRDQLFANELMLLPYYIAALNVEHAYYELTGTYEPFEGLCFVDTLDLAEGSQHQLGFMNETNTQRVERQRRTPITVVIGNPPYNMNQQNENDNNKNRKYEVIDKRVAETYAKSSAASNKTALSDPYVKFFRWATDRLQGRDGIVCLVSNNSFVDQHAFDGMRELLLNDFTGVYHVDLHGNVRRNPKLSGTTHNVFGIQVGVGITVAVRRKGVAPAFRPAGADLKVGSTGPDPMGLSYYRLPEDWRKEEKLDWLARRRSINSVQWTNLVIGSDGSWIEAEHGNEFARFIPVASKAAKGSKLASAETVFKAFSVGVKTNRDNVVYDFQREVLVERVKRFIEDYNAEVDRFKRSKDKKTVDDFVRYDQIKWSRDLKLDLQRGNSATFDDAKVRSCLYRPFCRRYLFFDRVLNEEVYVMPSIFPTPGTEIENCVIVTSDVAYRAPRLSAMVTSCLPDLHLCAAVDSHQCFPFYVYDEDGTNRRENITDWVLEHFRQHYGDNTITKWDIFYYVYGILHHPEYRTRYAENLKRELPRIPLVGTVIPRSEATRNLALKSQGEIPRCARDDSREGDSRKDESPAAATFWAVSRTGKELADLHINYEKVEPYPLQFLENRDLPFSYRVEDKMRLSKDKRSLKVNDSLTLSGIPPEVFEYRLGNRSALEWVIDQYQVTEDKKSGIRSDPNRADDPEYIVRLVGQVIHVSLEMVRNVGTIARLPLQAKDPQEPE